MRPFSAMAVLGLLLVVTTTSTAALPPNVKGVFVRSTHTTVCFQGEPCDPPPQATFLMFTRNGHSTRVRLGANGSFAVRLAAGNYAVTVLPAHSGAVSPATVRVPRVGVIHPRLVQRAVPAPA